MTDTAAELARRLQTHLAPAHLELIDDSARHVGHAEAKSGSHFQATIVSDKFVGLSLLQRHRLIYTAVGDFGVIALHALSLTALTPEEFSKAQPS